MKSRDDRSEDDELDTMRSRSQDKCGLHGSLTAVKLYNMILFLLFVYFENKWGTNEIQCIFKSTKNET